MKAMVLAAGVGSRLDPLTSETPKPMVPVANRPVMEHILLLLKQHGINDIVSNLHYLPDQIRNYFQDGSKFSVNLTFHHEKKLSGDAGGIRACKSFLQDDTFLVIMGDLLTDANLTAIIEAHKRKGAIATIALKQVDDVSQFGVALLDDKGFISGFQEKPAQHEALSNLASTGIYVLEPEVFKHIPQTGDYGFGRQLFPDLVAKKLPVLGFEINEYWSDVGTISQYHLSNFQALDKKVNVQLSGNKTKWGYKADNATINETCQIQGKLMVGKNSKIGANVKINGHVVIGDNCTIGNDADLTDVVIWSDVEVPSSSCIKNSIATSNCLVENKTMSQFDSCKNITSSSITT